MFSHSIFLDNIDNFSSIGPLVTSTHNHNLVHSQKFIMTDEKENARTHELVIADQSGGDIRYTREDGETVSDFKLAREFSH